MRGPHSGYVGRCCPHRGADVDRDAHQRKKRRHFGNVIAVAKAKRGCPQQVAGDGIGASHGFGQRAHDLQERLIRAEIFFALIAGQIERNDRDRQADGFGEAPRIILNKFRRTRCANNHRFGLEAGIGIAGGVFEQVGGITTQIAGLKCCIGDRGPRIAALNHCEQQIGIGIALRRMKDVVQTLHARGDAHGPHMGRAFICPEGKFHSAASRFSKAWRRRGRENSPARSPACS